MTALVHAADCSARPSRSGEEPHLLTVTNTRTGLTITSCTTCGASATTAEEDAA